MRSQASELGRRICSLEMLIPDAQGLSNHESSIPGGAKGRAEGGPAGWTTVARPKKTAR